MSECDPVQSLIDAARNLVGAIHAFCWKRDDGWWVFDESVEEQLQFHANKLVSAVLDASPDEGVGPGGPLYPFLTFFEAVSTSPHDRVEERQRAFFCGDRSTREFDASATTSTFPAGTVVAFEHVHEIDRKAAALEKLAGLGDTGLSWKGAAKLYGGWTGTVPNPSNLKKQIERHRSDLPFGPGECVTEATVAFLVAITQKRSSPKRAKKYTCSRCGQKTSYLFGRDNVCLSCFDESRMGPIDGPE